MLYGKGYTTGFGMAAPTGKGFGKAAPTGKGFGKAAPTGKAFGKAVPTGKGYAAPGYWAPTAGGGFAKQYAPGYAGIPYGYYPGTGKVY